MQFNKYCDNQLLIILMKVILQNLQNKNFVQINLYSIHKRLNVLAFSLIELSIVLIIIGLLVAGITGSASLIETTNVQSFVNKVYDWKRNINTFYSLKGRLPGNISNSYYIGELYTENNDPFSPSQVKSYTISDFGLSSYEDMGGSTAISHCGAFWLDLYLAKIGDFQPMKENIKNCNIIGQDLNIFQGDLRMIGPRTIILSNNKGRWPAFYNSMQGVYFQFIDTGTHIKPRIFLKLDKKLDDAIYDTGDMRGFCYTSRTSSAASNQIDYQTAINLGKTCHDFYYKLIDYKML